MNVTVVADARPRSEPDRRGGSDVSRLAAIA